MTRAVLPRVLVLAAVALGGCGSSGGSPTPTIKPGLDPCVVGTWKSTAAHGTVNSADGTLHIPLSGGEGQALVIRRDGTAVLTYDGSSPEQGTGTDGSKYVVSITGQVAGRVTTSAGQLTFDVNDQNSATQKITKDGAVLQSVHSSPQLVSTYSCSSRSTLTAVSNGITVTFAYTAA